MTNQTKIASAAESYKQCPFCLEKDFDAVGLKIHLTAKHCDAFESLSVSLPVTRHFSQEKKQPAANVESSADKCANNIFDAEGEWPERCRPDIVARFKRQIIPAIQEAIASKGEV